MSKVTVKQAAQLVGKTKETINKATNTSKLSYSLNASGHKVIDIAELERVYELVTTVEELSKQSQAVSDRQVESDSEIKAEMALVREKLAASEAMQKSLIDERDRERRQLQDEIANLRENLSKAQDQNSKALLLITDQSQDTTDRVGDWEKSIKALERRITNTEEQAKRERQLNEENQRQLDRYKRALRAERSKTPWQKLFG